MSMNLLPGIESTASALNVEKVRMNLVAQNIANANTTSDSEGNVYKRKVISFGTALDKATGAEKVVIKSINEDSTPTRWVYNPGHPDANGEGMVEMPNVEVSREMVDMITSSRSYEANLQMVRTSRQIAKQVLSIGQ